MPRLFQHLRVKSVNQDADLPPSNHFPQGILAFAEPENAALDIVFIHGLTGDWQRTWTYPDAQGPWPQTLLPSRLPNARILTYGYDAYFLRPGHLVSTNRLRDHSKDLLNALTTYRAGSSALQWPIIFVVHSLGGLLCKDMLLLSRDNPEQHLCFVFEHTLAIAFMGTPHTGSVLANWAMIPASSLGVVTSVNRSLLSVLQTRSEVLSRIQDDFLSMLRRLDQTGRHLEITCFCETLPMPIVGQIVPQESAGLPGYNVISLRANHRDLVRYKDQNEHGFKLLLGELRRWMLHARQMAKSGCWPVESPVVQSWLHSSLGTSWQLVRERQKCLSSLAFAEMNKRQENIEPPNEATCTWIFQDPCYKIWLNGEEQSNTGGLLWVKGKPGSGKSTLMKSMVSKHVNELEQTDEAITVAFFFNARGAAIEKSPLGLYRTLVYQLLDQSEEILQEFYPIFNPIFKRQDVLLGQRLLWESGQLSRFFHTAISKPRGLVVQVFVDALDECDDDEVRQIVRNFEKSIVAARKHGAKLRICWSSRHYPTISNSYGLELRMEDRNAPDINLYIEQELRLPAEYNKARLTKSLIRKASGVFLWVELVVQRLLKASDQGLDQADLETLLNKTPTRLEDYFAEILDTLGSSNQEKSLDLMAFVIFAYSPVNVAEIYLALGLNTEPAPRKLEQVESLINPSLGELRRIGRLITDLSGGMFEVVDSSSTPDHHGEPSRTIRLDSIVQVIHETVRDFLLGSRGLQKIDPLSGYLHASSHARISKMCCNWLGLNEFRLVPGASSILSLRKTEAITGRLGKPVILPTEVADHPFTTYAFEHIFNHMSLSGNLEVAVKGSSFGTEKITSWRNALEGWIFYCAYRLLESRASDDDSRLSRRIKDGLKFAARYASAFFLTSVEVFTLLSCLHKLDFCFTDLCPPYAPRRLQDFQISRTLTYTGTTFCQICWPKKFVPFARLCSGFEDNLKAAAPHAFAIRFTIHPVSDLEKLLQSLRRQPASLPNDASDSWEDKKYAKAQTQVWPEEVRMGDYTVLPNAEIPWSRAALTPELYVDFCTTYQASHRESEYFSLLIVERPPAAGQARQQLPPLELLNWKYGLLSESL